MRKGWIAGWTLGGMAWALAGAAAAQSSAGCTVAALVGQAQAGVQALTVGSELQAGMELQTGPDSRLRLRCADGSSLVMAANTRLRLEVMALQGGQRQELRWQLSLGLIGQKVSPGGRWSVRTPTAVTAVRGTEFTVEVGEAQQTAVLTQEGAVDVQAAAPSTRNLAGLVGGSAGAIATIGLTVLQGTDCQAGRCGPAARWSAERVQRTLDRLAGV
jgi:hypothetical protein